MSYKAYPNSSPEFRILQKENGLSEMQVRYIHVGNGYTGKWIPIKTEKENDTTCLIKT
jgi:hypothetical protein